MPAAAIMNRARLAASIAYSGQCAGRRFMMAIGCAPSRAGYRESEKGDRLGQRNVFLGPASNRAEGNCGWNR
jgi:hypothetical protein